MTYYQQVTQRLKDYSKKLIPYPATEKDLLLAEEKLCVRFPESYRQFQLEFGDFQGSPIDVWSVFSAKEAGMPVDPWTCSGTIVHVTEWERNGGDPFYDNAHPYLPQHLIPVGETPEGNLYCLDTADYDGDECSVKLWILEDGQEQQPATVAKNFLDWLEQEIIRTENDTV